ncbi:MAG: cytochrome c oxidase assembly protein [Actinomycetota bacterium]|nr:cytochrome c oxidase assembly protein [Actinomycetota bacterium]
MARSSALTLATFVALAVPAAAFAHGGEVPVSQLSGAWHAPLLLLAAAALAGVLFAQAFLRLRRRGRSDRAGWDRPLLFALGLAVAVLPLVSPLDAIGDEYLLSAHMLEHVLIGDLAAALLVLAVRGPLVVFMLPPPFLRRVAALRPLLGFLLRPWVTFTLWGAVLLGWHIPSAYDYTLSHPVVHELEHVMFVLVGTLAWTQLIDPARHERLSRPGRILFAAGMIVLMHPVMDSMLFSGTPLYKPYTLQDERLFGLAPLTDQRIAGAVMMVEQLLTLGTCIGILLWPYLKKRHQTKLASLAEQREGA